MDVWDAGDVFHEPPLRSGSEDATAEVVEHQDTMAGRGTASCSGEILAWRTADDTLEGVGRRCECVDILAVKCVRSSDDTITSVLEAAAEEVRAGKK